MWFSSWLRNRTVSPQRRPASRFRPAFEVLEDRAVPAMFLVNTTLDVLGHANGVLSLRQATLDAKAAWSTTNTIIVPAGTYNLTQPTTPIPIFGGSLKINDSNFGLTISGAGAGTTIIDGLGLNRVFEVTIGTVSISGLTIQGGKPVGGSGAGIFNQGGTLTVSNCIFTGNIADFRGGAIANLGGTMTVNHCVFAGNSAPRIGSGCGGAIWNQGSMTVSDSTFSGNSTWAKGGAVYGQGPMTISNCTFTGNSSAAAFGGGAIENEGAMTVSNCTLSGNSAAHDGGGIFNLGTLKIRSSTVNGNIAPLGTDLYNGAKVSFFDTTIGGIYYP